MTKNDLTESAPHVNGPTLNWREVVLRYQTPSATRALWQTCNTLIPYFTLWYLMYLSLSVSWWLTIPLALLTGGFTVRAFIIFHDCGHGSFFKTSWANHLLGAITGVLTFTPYFHWRWEHAVHHTTSGDLDRRGIGDVWTMTVQEYLASNWWKRACYRIVRNPGVLFLAGPLVQFLILHRLPNMKAPARERYSVYWTNLALGLQVVGMLWIFGLKAYIIIQLTVMVTAGTAGIWLFYVQHQFDGAYWERRGEWDFVAAALKGSSFYKLPKVLQWFSGNIGFHHIHHLSSRIPNYNLEKCHKTEPLFQTVKPVTLLTSLKSLTYRLWDEQQRKLVGFKHLRSFRNGAAQTARN